jgi:hypothetical protein
MHRFDRHGSVEPRSDVVRDAGEAKESSGLISVDVRASRCDRYRFRQVLSPVQQPCPRWTSISVYLPACIHPDRPLPNGPDHAAGLWKSAR